MEGRVIVIGASFNGIAALSELFKRLPADLPAAVLVVQHTAPSSPGFLPQILSKFGGMKAVHPHENERMEKSVAYVAPPDHHMLVRPGGYIHLSHGPKENRTRPAVDATLRSAALALGAKVVGVVLTGYLDDGTAGLAAVKDCGGIAIVQDPAEATAPSMPLSALRHVRIDHVGTIEAIAELLVHYALDAPGLDGSIPSLLKLEEQIADGALRGVDWPAFERLCQTTALNCPECRASLLEIRSQSIQRFRCRSGHAFSPMSLLDAQAEARENLQSALLASLLEEIALAKQLLREGEDPVLLSHLHERAERLQMHASLITAWLGNPPLGGRSN